MSKLDRRLIGMILEGRNLAAKDQNGLSDPFLTFGPVDKKGNWNFLEKKDKALKSKVVRKTSNPVWRTPFEIPVDSSCKGLKVEVWDWDLIGTDFMGSFTIMLSDLTKGREVEAWYKLLPRSSKKETVSGEVLVRLTYTSEPKNTNVANMLLGSTLSRRLSEVSLPSQPAATASHASISEEEYAAMDDMRSGEIELLMPALLKYSESRNCLHVGLTAFAKWATIATVPERITLMEKYKRAFDSLAKSAETHKTDGAIVFYALGCLPPFLRLFEAKAYWNTEIATLLAHSLKDPPTTLDPEDTVRHRCNCLISLSNACTSSKVGSNTELIRCIDLVLTSGAVKAATTLITSTSGASASHEALNKHIYTLLVKIAHNDKAKSVLHDAKLVSITADILKHSNDPITLWLATDTLNKYAIGSDVKRLNEVMDIDHLLASLSRLSTLECSGLHGASLNSSIVYLLYTLSDHWKTGGKSAITTADTHLITMITTRAVPQYLSFIPKSEQKCLLPQRVLILVRLLCKLSTDVQKLVTSNHLAISTLIANCSKYPEVLEEATNFFNSITEGNTPMVSKPDASGSLKSVLETAELDETLKQAFSGFVAKFT